MADVEIYSSFFCGFSQRAKSLLKRKGVEFQEVDVLMHPGRRPEMTERSGGKTSVPQIFINGRHIGGCRELYALDESGELDRLLTEGT